MKTLSFIAPHVWLAALFVPLLAWWLFRRDRARLETGKLLGLDLRPTRQWLVYPAVFLLFIAALSRPYDHSEEVKLHGAGSDIVAVVDVSLSMLAQDTQPSRLVAARRKLLDLVALLQTAGRGDRMGIVLFSGEAYLFAPLTNDYEVLRTFIQSISTDLVTSRGTAIGAALGVAASAATDSGTDAATVMLLTDGEDPTLAASESSPFGALATRFGIIGFGTPQGAPIPQGDGAFVRDSHGQVVVSKLNEPALASLAERFDGVYGRATLGDDDLKAVLSRPAPGQRTQGTTSFTVYHELGPWVLGGILLIVLAAFVTRGRDAILAVAILVVTAPLTARAEDATLYDGWKAYQDGDFARAAEIFSGELQRSPQDMKIRHALGSSLYKAQKLDPAGREFESVASGATDPALRFDGYYDLGNTRVLQHRLKEAIAAYDSALAIKPGDEQALHNREVARKLLEEEKKHQPTPTPTPSAAPSASPQPSPEASPSPSPNPTGEPSPSPNPQATPSPGSGDDEGTPTPNPSASPTASATSSSSAGEGGTPTPKVPSTPAASSTREAKSEADLSKQEAEAWLNSLPDAPVLLRRETGRNRQKEVQGW